MRCIRITLLLGSCAMFLVAGTATAGLWEVLGNLSPEHASEAVAISADGSVIVGSSGTLEGQRAFRWTLETGIQALPMPPSVDVTMTWATDVSADGSTIVGYGGNNFGSRQGWEGLIWQNSAIPSEIAVQDKGVWLHGVSGDGLVAVGSQHAVEAMTYSEAFRLPVGGTPTPLSGPLYTEGIVQSSAAAISADGQVIVGDITQLDPIVRSGFRWTEATGMTPVGDFAVNAASRDGSVVVGTVVVPGGEGFQACRWTDAEGVVPLGLFAEGFTSQALGVSGDGSRIVGFVENMNTDLRQAFLWEEEMGMRLLQDVLHERYGFDLTGWSLTKAYAISDDGRTVVGRGYSPQGVDEAWRAVLAPEPGTVTLLAAGCVCGLALAYRRRHAKR